MSVIAKKTRLNCVRSQLAEKGEDGLLLTHLPDVRWACGFTGTNGFLIVRSPEKGGEAHFFTDGRYDEQAKEEVGDASVHVYHGNRWDAMTQKGILDGLQTVSFQSDHLTVHTLSVLEKRFPGIDWCPQDHVVTRHVAQKESGEIERITKAQRVTESVFDAVLDQIEAGRTEKEVAAEIVYEHLRRGAEKMSFDPIVAAGPNAAKPHARPTDRSIREGELVVIDMGCFVEGYASDMTRTVSVGEPSAAALRGYEAVLAAQRAALEAARAGITGQELDAAARSVLEEAGLGDFFSHSLGHGVGLQIHEWPRVSKTAEEKLPANACITIEPGVYVPEEQYGVRIEDLVVLREEGCENLTQVPKDLLIL